MAMLKYAAGAIEYEGKFGGQIFRQDQCGGHVQAKPRHIDAGSRKQRHQRNYFSRARTAWSRHRWTTGELHQWWNWCYYHPKKNKKGETRYFHPFLAFLSVNMRRLRDGKPVIYLPEF